jgi:uncharacterized protein YjdB
MISKSRSLVLSGMALLCAVILTGCNNSSPTLRFVGIGPTSGTIYVSAQPTGAVKGARRIARPAVNPKQKAAISAQDITTATCGSMQFAATGYFSDGTTQPQSSTLVINWSSSNTSVATVDNTGLATGIAAGTTNIGATSLSGVAATAAALEVDQLNTITMSPTSGNIPNGTTGFAFMALGNFTLANGSSAQQDISTQVTWASSNTNVATVDTSGNITTVGQGTTTITATSCDGITVGKAQLMVTAPPPPPPTLQVTPATGTIASGTTLVFTAMQIPSGGGTPVTPSNPVTWSSDTPSVATVDPTTGIALAVAPGTAHITATETVTGYTGPPALLTVQAAAARYAYVANLNDNPVVISSYTVSISSSGGSFSPPTNITLKTEAAQQVLIHPSGDLLYYIDAGGSLNTMTVDSTTGNLSTTSLPTTTASCDLTTSYNFNVGVIDPLGRFIYVITASYDKITSATTASCLYGFQITQPSTAATAAGTVGTLTPIPGLTNYTDANLNFPTWVMTDRTGSYLYVVNNTNATGQGTVSQYSIDQTTGALTALSPAFVNAGNGTTNDPQFGTTDVNGHLFVANDGSGATDQTVSAFNITNTGQLVQIGSDVAISGPANLINVLTDPSGKYLYALDAGTTGNGQVFAFSYAISSSALTLTQIGSPQPTGNSPDGMAIDPTGALLAIDDSNRCTTSPCREQVRVELRQLRRLVCRPGSRRSSWCITRRFPASNLKTTSLKGMASAIPFFF